VELCRKRDVGAAKGRVKQEEDGVCTVIAGAKEEKGPAGAGLLQRNTKKHAVSTLLIRLIP
jgi:hypothetical protein